MLSLPTILLVLAALSLGATVIAILIALRSQREASSAIFPIVREEETLRARRARLSIFVWIAVTALFLGGWLATLRQRAPAEQVASASAETPPANEPVVAASSPTPPAEPSSTPVGVAPVVVEQVTEPTITNTPPPPATLAPAPNPTATPLPATSTLTPVPAPAATSTSTPLPTDTPAPPTATLEPSPTATETPIPPTPTPTRHIVVPQVASTSPPRTPAPSSVRVGPIQFATEITPELEPIDPKTIF